MDVQHDPIKEYHEAASVLVSRDGDLTLAEELINIFRSYNSTVYRSWESVAVFDVVRLDGVRKALTLPRAIRVEGRSTESVQAQFRWIENDETRMVGMVAVAVKGFLQNAGVVARAIGSKTSESWERAYCQVKTAINELPESTCTNEVADLICHVLEKNLPVLSSEVAIWRKGHSGLNGVLAFVRKHWLVTLLSFVGGGTFVIKIYLPAHETQSESLPNLHVEERLDETKWKELARENHDANVFVNCSFSGCTFGDSIVCNVKASATASVSEVIRESSLPEKVAQTEDKTPLLQDPPALMPIIHRLRTAIENKDGKAAIVEAMAGESIIAEYWKPYTNDSFTITSSFAENVANVYITLSQEAMGRGDFTSAAIRCGIARQMVGTNAPPHVLAIQMLCAVRCSGGELLALDDYSIEMFSKMRPRKLLYAVFDNLARWGYLVPRVFDFQANRLKTVNLEERFGFSEPLHYANRMTLHVKTADGQPAIASPDYVFQWRGFDKYTLTDLNAWAKNVLANFAKNKDVIERGRKKDR